MEQWQIELNRRVFEAAEPSYGLVQIAKITFDPETGIIKISKRCDGDTLSL